MIAPKPPPDCLPRGLAVLFLCVATMASLLLACSGSSPRFRAKNSSEAARVSSEKRFATKIRQEETAEDDRKVNIEDVKERFSAHRAAPGDRSSAIDRKKVMTEVLGLIGTPYSFGNGNADGMDCSAFTAHLYDRAVGRTLPRTTQDQYRMGKSVGNDRLQFGDLVFFNTTGESPSHVGIFIDDDLFAHASVSYGVTISSLQSSYYKHRYIGSRRVVE